MERSAVETYDRAIEKYASETAAVTGLRRIRDEHASAVTTLEQNVRDMGGTPETDSGAWGSFANAVQSAANLFGAESAIQALIAGEKHGLDDYEDAVSNDDVMPECKTMMETRLIPPIRQHIAELERLQDAA